MHALIQNLSVCDNTTFSTTRLTIKQGFTQFLVYESMNNNKLTLTFYLAKGEWTYVATVFLYPWATSFDVLGVSIFIEALIFVLILIVGLVYA